MDRKVIKEALPDSDWMGELDGLTVEEAIAWLEGFPASAVLDSSNSYDYDSRIHVERRETDEEYTSRVEAERELALYIKR